MQTKNKSQKLRWGRHRGSFFTVLLVILAALAIGVIGALTYQGTMTCDHCALQQTADQAALVGAAELARRADEADAHAWVIASSRHLADLADLPHEDDICDAQGATVLVYIGQEGSGKCHGRAIPDQRHVTVVMCAPPRSVLGGPQQACAIADFGTGRPYLLE